MLQLLMTISAGAVFGSACLEHERCFVRLDPGDDCERVCLSQQSRIYGSATRLLTDRGVDVGGATEVRSYQCSSSHRIYFFFCKEGEFPLVLVAELPHGAVSPFLWDSE